MARQGAARHAKSGAALAGSALHASACCQKKHTSSRRPQTPERRGGAALTPLVSGALHVRLITAPLKDRGRP